MSIQPSVLIQPSVSIQSSASIHSSVSTSPLVSIQPCTVETEKKKKKKKKREQQNKADRMLGTFPKVGALVAVFWAVVCNLQEHNEAALLSDWSCPPPWPIFISVNMLAGSLRAPGQWRAAVRQDCTVRGHPYRPSQLCRRLHASGI